MIPLKDYIPPTIDYIPVACDGALAQSGYNDGGELFDYYDAVEE